MSSDYIDQLQVFFRHEMAPVGRLNLSEKISGLNKNLERVAGIEPACAAWKAAVLPLNYTRDLVDPTIGQAAGKAIHTFL